MATREERQAVFNELIQRAVGSFADFTLDEIIALRAENEAQAQLLSATQLQVDQWITRSERLEAENKAQKELLDKCEDALEFCSGTSYITDSHIVADEALAKLKARKEGA